MHHNTQCQSNIPIVVAIKQYTKLIDILPPDHITNAKVPHMQIYKQACVKNIFCSVYDIICSCVVVHIEPDLVFISTPPNV